MKRISSSFSLHRTGGGSAALGVLDAAAVEPTDAAGYRPGEVEIDARGYRPGAVDTGLTVQMPRFCFQRDGAIF